MKVTFLMTMIAFHVHFDKEFRTKIFNNLFTNTNIYF